MAAVHRIWIGNLSRNVAVEDLTATFFRFGDLAEGVRLRCDIKGAEAVITYDLKADATRALSVNDAYIVEDLVQVTWYEQRPEGGLFKEDS